jgi:hypothetical protein
MTPTPDEILDEARAAGIDWHKHWDDDGTNRLETFARAALAKWGTPTPAGEPVCSIRPTCEALARAVMLDQTGFDRKPDCYGIRQITNDDGVEEWEDIRTSPDVAREEADDMMATGRGEIYEVVPLFTAPPVREPLSPEQKQEIHNATGAGHALICLVESYLLAHHGITKGEPHDGS